MPKIYQDECITLYHNNCFDILSDLEADHCITDPPYSSHVHNNSMIGSNIPHKVGIGYESITESDIMLFAKLINIKRWMLIFGDVESTHIWRKYLLNKYEYIRTGAYVKTNPAPQFSGDRPGTGFEAISIFHGPNQKKMWNGGGKAAVWQSSLVQGSNRLQAGQKPLKLMLDILTDFTNEGETIIDSFVGSGQTLLAARQLGRKGIGIEKDFDRCMNAKALLSKKTIF